MSLPSATDWWLRLRHGGQLLDARQLAGLPHPQQPPHTLAESLRAAVTGLPDEGAAEGDALTTLLDVVFEQVAGLRVGWLKGSKVTPEAAQSLLDGTRLKPRRVWTGPHGAQLQVFTSSVKRIGLGKGKRPVAQVTEYLRRRGTPLGLLTNGRQWRLIHADTDTLAWAEWDADAFFEGGQLSDTVAGLARILGWTSMVRPDQDADSPLITGIRETRQGQAKLSATLGENVRKAVEILLVSRRDTLPAELTPRQLQPVYRAGCHFVMRLVVVLFAEARGMLPRNNPIYHHGYSLGGLLESLERTPGLRRRQRQSAWPRLLALFRLLFEGSPHPALTLLDYGGELFRPGQSEGGDLQQALCWLESPEHAPYDDTLHTLITLLTTTRVKVPGTGWVRATVDFSDLSSEYIGILYEGLLDYELRRVDGDDPVVFLGLGDQPALPLSRLEGMEPKALAALVDKVKGSGGLVIEDDADDDHPAGDDRLPQETTGHEETDPREQATARAMRWAEQAVVVGKLAKKPRGTGVKAEAMVEKLRKAAQALIPALKLPGELYLVRWGGTRKGAGTFYTRPQLTTPTVRRTLEPLLYDAHHDSGERRIRTPEAILRLKVCDPAMGSGSFLVAALRVLTDAVVEALYTHNRLAGNGRSTTLELPTFAESDRVIPYPLHDARFREELEDRVKRYVVEHCLYGVDIDPLAVELGRVALWVETLDDRLPFTFLDHKLKPGNALVGCWLDRFRDYPILAWTRDSPDRKFKGVHHPADQWHKALAARKKQVVAELADVLSGQRPMGFSGGDDEQVKDAVKRVRELFGRLRRIPADQPGRRAKLYRDRIQHDPALDRLRTALDTWTALWFWPLDRLDVAPGPQSFLAPSEAALAVVREVRRKPSLRFFHWELEFPDVFHDPDSGFDAVVGNPPWEIQKPSSKEFFSDLDPLYRGYGKQQALRVQRELFEQHASDEEAWLAYLADYKSRGNWVRHAGEPFGDGTVAGHGGGDLSLVRGKANAGMHQRWRKQRGRHKGFADAEHPFRHQGSADLNTYKMFVEAGHALLREGGELGMIMPSGIYTDKGTGDLRRLLLERCTWRWLFGFENRRKIFDIHRSFKFCVLIARKGGSTTAVHAAFMRHELADWGAADGADYVLDYPAERVKAFSPRSLSVLEIRSQRDLEVLTKIYDNGVLLGDDGPDGWGIKYATEFHMTNDSKLFPSREKWEARGYRPDAYGRWIGPDGDAALPLYEGRMIGQFDFSEKGWVSGKGRTAVWREIPWEQKVVEPQYLMAEADAATRMNPRPWKLMMMNIGSATNQRTMFSSLGPNWPANHSLAVLSARETANDLPLCGSLNSYCYDWSLRLRVGGLNLSWFILEETPLPSATSAVKGLVAALVHGHHPAMSVAAAQHARVRRPALTPYERLRLRTMLDAIVAALYGLDRDDFAWILRDCDYPVAALDRDLTRRLDPKGFWRIDKDKPPELRHTVLSLVAFDALQQHITAAGDRDAGVAAFCEANDGDGWLLPDTLRLADHDLGHDDRAQHPQPVASALGPRFLDWQLAQSPEESWAECERHARVLMGDAPAPTSPARTPPTSPPSSLGPLFDSGTHTNREYAMITELRIKNFKAWDETHWLQTKGIRMARITFVLGTNSAGKSSLLQPLRLIKQTLESRDAAAQLVLDAPLDLGPFEELVHTRAQDAHLGLGLSFDLGDRRTSVDAEFELIGGTTGVRSLAYTLDQRQVSVTRTGTTTAYQLSTPDANHPGWTGVDLADPKENARQAFRPTRGFEFSTDATNALGPPIRGLLMAAIDDLHTLMDRFHYLGPIRRVPDREIRWKQQDQTVLGDEGADAVQVLLSESRRGKEQRIILNAVSKWLKHMEIADELEVKRIGRSMLYEIRIRRGDDSSNIVDVGMGVSQVLPVLVLLHFAPEGSVLMLDEPSVHLHPLAQSRLADAIATVAAERNLQVLMETHSEHMFRRVQYLMAKETLTPRDCALYYVERQLPSARLVELEADEFGRIKNWPEHLFGDAVGETGRQMRRMVARLREDAGDK